MSSMDHTEALARRVLETGGTEKERAELAGAALGLVAEGRAHKKRAAPGAIGDNESTPKIDAFMEWVAAIYAWDPDEIEHARKRWKALLDFDPPPTAKEAP